MQIYITNTIQMDGETEKILEVHDCSFTQKGDFYYLTYVNEEKERVMIKFDEVTLSMIRYSTPKSYMIFFKNGRSEVMIPTPLGYQYFETQTSHYDLHLDEYYLHIIYELQEKESQRVFATYDLKIEWK